jgi:hypothetical protein
VLDRSGSMNWSITEECSCDPLSNPRVVCADTENCRTRWAALATALDSSLSSMPNLSWGLKLFSSPGAPACAVVGGVEVPIGADDAPAAIRAEIAAITPAGETPTAAAITEATAYLETVTDANSRVILLVTDGKPDCGGDQPSVYVDDVDGTVNAITAAFDAGFLVYVVGIGIGASAANMDAFARAGGTGAHYTAQSPDGLAMALASISKAATCTFALDMMPPERARVEVYLNGHLVPQDANGGWSFAATARTIVLHGSYCEQALSGSPDTLQVLFDCDPPHSLIQP